MERNIILTALFCFFAAFSVTISAEVGEDVSEDMVAGHIEQKLGEVWITASDNEKEVMREGDIVIDNALIQTGDESWAVIGIKDDNGYIYIKENTSLTMYYYYSFKRKYHRVMINLVEGGIRCYSPDLPKMRSHFTVITPNASASTPGGDIEIDYSGGRDGEDGRSNIKARANYAAVKHLPQELEGIRDKKSVFVPQGRGVLVYTEKGLSVSREKLMQPAEDTFWTEKGLDVSFEKEESPQEKRIDKEIKKIHRASVWNTPVNMAQ